MTASFDVAIIGAGMVGASIAYHLGPSVHVLQLEAEHQPGDHATGRSAVLYFPAYGPAVVRALTQARRACFKTPPTGFANVPATAASACCPQMPEASR